ncbi:flagellar biosynthetic protein FliR [Rosenbergiella australiborealis]|uniref:Flagellar biosynthetic protein FliR n=1 Tax=Rosenbergiella australiborealis TaxID=1544696 RepID=A0ABS5T5B5_9GAMM|nr:flagellar biosynthetic protein FliR [Rosenbergiella australiborealis]MBT0727550.1 flagellar biosynthetic protein FliR [Rosenbergiella australiborealis]
MLDVTALYSHLLTFLLPWVRILAFLQFSPLAESTLISRKIRVLISLVLTALITPLLRETPLPALLSVTMLWLVAEQIIWGMVFGQLLQFAFSSMQTAGQIIAMNMGLSMAVQNDPVNGTSNTLIAQLFNLTMMLIFFAANGHLLLVTVLYKGFIFWPIGSALSWPSFQVLISSFGWIISAAVIIALPSTVIMLLIQGVFGLLNKVSASLNLFSLGFPLATLAGIISIALLIPALSEHYLSLTNQIIHQFDLLRGAHVASQ